MVGRSDSNDNMESNPEDAAAAEIRILKSKNNELAKALADAKISMKQTLDERDYFQKQLLNMHVRNAELLAYLKHVDQAARKSINAIVLSSNYITEIAQITMNSMQRPDISFTPMVHNGISPTPSSSKLQAVKPMIDGHVIYRPIINLRRVNEFSAEEIQRLRSAPSTSNVNGVSSDNNETTENGPRHRNSATDHNSLNPIDGLGDGMEDDDIDGASNGSEPESANNNRLHTIEELSETINSTRLEDDLSTLANANTSSSSTLTHSSQGPLLSGVFRDVRVYISPMQNVSQYLESLQGVTTNRRKSHTSKKTARKHFSPRTVSLDGNNQCTVTVKSATACSDQSNNNLSSANNSFEEQTSSILTSTRIGNNLDEARNSEHVNQSRWSNSFNSVTANENPHLFSKNSERLLSKTPKWVSEENRLNNQNYSTSFHTPSMQSTAYDPLEGPSTLLDGSNINKEKLERFSMLGLRPKHSIESRPSSSSPAATVLKRRERNKETTPKKKNKSIYVTKRKDNKKAIVSTKLINKRTSFSPLKVSQIKKRSSSSSKRNSLSNSSSKSSTSPIKNSTIKPNLRTPRRRTRTLKAIQYYDNSPSPISRKLKNSLRKLSNKKVKKRKNKNESLKRYPKSELNASQNNSRVSVSAASVSITSASTVSTSAVSDSTTSHTMNGYSKYVEYKKKSVWNSNENENRRHSKSPRSPKRARTVTAKMSSFKEPSLRKKMRRS